MEHGGLPKEPEGRCKDCEKCETMGYVDPRRMLCARHKPKSYCTWPDAWCPDFKRKQTLAEKAAEGVMNICDWDIKLNQILRSKIVEIIARHFPEEGS